jgi:hypothetical protein
MDHRAGGQRWSRFADLDHDSAAVRQPQARHEGEVSGGEQRLARRDAEVLPSGSLNTAGER